MEPRPTREAAVRTSTSYPGEAPPLLLLSTLLVLSNSRSIQNDYVSSGVANCSYVFLIPLAWKFSMDVSILTARTEPLGCFQGKGNSNSRVFAPRLWRTALCVSAAIPRFTAQRYQVTRALARSSSRVSTKRGQCFTV